jgi:hypothetical protein
MSLSGSFATMPFPEVLQWISDSRRSGMLAVTLEFEERYLKLEGGDVVALGSDDPRMPDLTRLVLTRQLIDEVRLRRVLARHKQTHVSLYRLLVDEGHILGPTLNAAVRAHVKDVVLQLFLWDEGRFLFSSARGRSLLLDALPAELDLAVDPSIPVRELLMDGMRRLDEWRRIAEVMPSDYTTVFALGRAADLPALEVLAEAGEPLAIGEVCLRIARPRFDVVAELFEARRRGLLAVDSSALHLDSGPQRSAGLASLVANAGVLVDEQQFDEASALLRSALDLDPYDATARQLLQRARGEQIEELYRRFPPYCVPALRGAPSHGTVLSPRERYLLQRIDGRHDVAMLTMTTPLGELELLRALRKLQHAGLVEIR